MRREMLVNRIIRLREGILKYAKMHPTNVCGWGKVSSQTQSALPCPFIVLKNVGETALPGLLTFSAASLFRTRHSRL